LKPLVTTISAKYCCGLNGLGSPFGIETHHPTGRQREQRYWLNGLGSPFGIETLLRVGFLLRLCQWLNGLGSPFGIETRNKLMARLGSERLNGLGSPFGIETRRIPGQTGLIGQG